MALGEGSIRPIKVAGTIVLLFGLSKLLGVVVGTDEGMVSDPVTGLSFKGVIIGSAIGELMLGACLLVCRKPRVGGLALVVFASGALAYHVLFAASGISLACPCAGFVGEWLPIDPNEQTITSRAVATWLWVVGVVEVGWSGGA